MEQDWSSTFSPPDRTSAMFFHELGDQLTATTPNHPSVVGPGSTSGRSQSNTPNPNTFVDQDHYFLQQIENNLYDRQSNATPMGATPRPPMHQNQTQTQNIQSLQNPQNHPNHQNPRNHQNHPNIQHVQNHQLQGNTPTSHHQNLHPAHEAFSLNSLDFVLPEELHYENGNTMPLLANLDHPSSAFPPGLPPPQTPSMLAKKDKLVAKQAVGPSSSGASSTGFASPILPSQNDKSYNEQHFFHKQQYKQRSHRNSLDASAASFQYLLHQSHVRPDAIFTPLVSPAVTPHESQLNVNKQQPIQTMFEPLTSPALNAQNEKRRTSSSVFSPHNEEIKPPSHKRKTPHGTPILQASSGAGNGAISRTGSSSSIQHHHQSKQSPSVKAMNAFGATFERLPEASVDLLNLALTKNSTDAIPMLPPQGKKVEITKETPTMMGFTMGRLAESTQSNGSVAEERPKAPSKRLSFTKSSIQPPNNAASAGSGTSVSNSINLSTVKLEPSASSCETSPVLASMDDFDSRGSTKRLDKSQPGKKASHKVAEQGRRNRMNVAIHELATLIPQKYHDEVSIPSKATTVELASKYITDLLMELKERKR